MSPFQAILQSFFCAAGKLKYLRLSFLLLVIKAHPLQKTLNIFKSVSEHIIFPTSKDETFAL